VPGPLVATPAPTPADGRARPKTTHSPVAHAHPAQPPGGPGSTHRPPHRTPHPHRSRPRRHGHRSRCAPRPHRPHRHRRSTRRPDHV